MHCYGYAQPVEKVNSHSKGSTYGDQEHDEGKRRVHYEWGNVDQERFEVAIYRSVDNVSCGITQPEVTCLVYWDPGAAAEKPVGPFMNNNTWEGENGNGPSGMKAWVNLFHNTVSLP